MSLYNVTGVLGFHGYDLYRYAEEHWLPGNGVTEDADDASEAVVREPAARRGGSSTKPTRCSAAIRE